MSAPLIPYLPSPQIPLSFLRYIPLLNEWIDPGNPPSIKPFGMLVALGVFIGVTTAIRRGKERGYEPNAMLEYLFWTVGTAFVVSHILDAVFYHPRMVLGDPLYLLRIWDGLSSYGGMIGMALGSLGYKWRRRAKILGFADVTCSVTPLAWVFGRAGCSVVHDHPGIHSNAWFAVQYPAYGGGIAGRLDLGLIEMVLTIPLAIAFAILWRRQPRRPDGYYMSLLGICYAPVRFLLDFLRVSPQELALSGDERYWSLTPAQWASFVLFALGVTLLMWIRRKPAPGRASVSGAVAGADEAGAGPVR